MKLKILLFFLLTSAFFGVKAETPSDFINEGSSLTGVVLGQNYPNPAKSKTVINVEFTSAEAVLSIYNVLGKLVEEIVVSSSSKTVTIDVSNYQDGIYLYSIEADGLKVTKRMTVKK